MKCLGLTKKKLICKRKINKGSFCYQHKNKICCICQYDCSKYYNYSICDKCNDNINWSNNNSY